MKINTALILCAGYGKRLNPITLKKPKPLIYINETALLEKTISFIEELNIKFIKINVFYLKDQIIDFISNRDSKSKIEVIEDGDKILDTGGGIHNLIKSSDEDDFIIFNPDTIWEKNNLETVNNMANFYFDKKIKNLLMVVNKSKSFDQRLKGDFELEGDLLARKENNNYIYTGCQIINKKLFKEINEKSFSISKIWDNQLKDESLYGYESLENFIHLTDLEIYNKLLKNN